MAIVPEHRVGSGGAAVFATSFKGNLDVIERLIEADIDLSTRAENGWNALNFAVYGGQPKVVERLLEVPLDVTGNRSDRWSALHLAARFGRVEIGRMLLKANADVMQVNSRGRTPFHIAARKERTKMMNLFLSHIRDRSNGIYSNSTEMVEPGDEAVLLSTQPFVQLEESSMSILNAIQSLCGHFPEDHILQDALGHAYFRRKQYDPAFASFHNAILLNPANRGVMFHNHLTHSVFCDLCSKKKDQLIKGYRYLCTICFAFDLCEKCLNSEFLQHDPDHAFLCIPRKDWEI
jgi:hypothetical protein